MRYDSGKVGGLDNGRFPARLKYIMNRRHFFLSPLLTVVGMGLLLLPAALRLPYYRRTTVDGITTIDEAVVLCQRSGLKEWALVHFAQELTAKKFAVYSALNLWDTPSRAFVHGMGYCTQYNLALKQILDRLGFQTTAVFALKTRIFDNDACDTQPGVCWQSGKPTGECSFCSA